MPYSAAYQPGWTPVNVSNQLMYEPPRNPWAPVRPGEEFPYQQQLQGQQQQGNLAQLLAQFGYQQQLGTQQQGFTQQNLAAQLANQLAVGEQGYKFQKGLGTQGQEFTQANLATQLANQLRMGTQGQEFTQANLATTLANQLKLGGAQFGQQTQLSEQQARQQAALYKQILEQDVASRADRLRAAQGLLGYGDTGSYDAALQSQAGVESEQIGKQWETMQRNIEGEYGRGGASLSSARDRAMEEGRSGMASALRASRTTAAVESNRARQAVLAQLLSLAR